MTVGGSTPKGGGNGLHVDSVFRLERWLTDVVLFGMGGGAKAQRPRIGRLYAHPTVSPAANVRRLDLSGTFVPVAAFDSAAMPSDP